MRMATLHCVGGIGPLTLNPLEIGEARAVLVLVDHSGRQQRQVPRQLRAGEREFLLCLVHGVASPYAMLSLRWRSKQITRGAHDDGGVRLRIGGGCVTGCVLVRNSGGNWVAAKATDGSHRYTGVTSTVISNVSTIVWRSP